MRYKVLVSCTVEFDLEIDADSNEEAEKKARAIKGKHVAEYLDTEVVHEDFSNDYKNAWIDSATVHEQSLIENDN